MFDEIGMDAIIEKRNKITAYLEFVLQIDKEVDSTLKLYPNQSCRKRLPVVCLLHGEGRSLLIT
jgi:kynureninase